ncbi:MAG: leucine-rich repeat protein, partial [Clostridia bacterium]|nr:leucine-rich repeat protein [Clostridia bacterium]
SAGIASSNGPCSDMKINGGTSMASPQVAAAVALLRLNPEFKDYTAEQVEKKLYELAVDQGEGGKDPYYGNGMVNFKYFEYKINDDYIEFLENGVAVEGCTYNKWFDKSFEIEAICSNPELKVIYTTDDTLPTLTNGQEYTGAIAVERSAEMKFVGFKVVDGEIVEMTDVYRLSYFYEYTPVDECFFVNPNGWLKGYTGNYKELVLPPYIDGLSARGIDMDLFRGNTMLEKISMPGITTVSYRAFEGCLNLRYIDVPNLTTLYADSFKNLNLEEFNFGHRANSSKIDKSALHGTKIKNITVDPDNTTLYFDGVGLYSTTALIAIEAGKSNFNLDIKSKVEIAGVEYTITTINASIANGAKINCLTIPETITTIGSFAFKDTQINTLYYNSINCSASGYTEQVDSWTKKYNNVFRDAYIDTLVFGEKVETYPERMFWELDDVSNFVINSASMVMSRQGAWIAENRSIHGITLNFTDEITKDYLGQLESSGLIPYGVNPFISKSVLPEDKTTTNGKFKNYNYSVQFGEYYYHSSASLDGQFAIYVTFDDGGFVSPHRGLKYFKSGTTQTYIIEPASGYQVESITVDGVVLSEEETAKAVENGYKFVKLSENHTLDVSFIKMSEFDIEIIPSEHGSIRRISGSYAMGDSATFEITPDAGYHIKHLIIDGEIVEASSEYTFENISANHTIGAVFEANTDTKYIVKHWQQALSAEGAVAVDGKYYILVETDKLAGTTDTETNVVAKDYVGFTALAFNQTNIAGNGNAVIDIYYDRNEYSVFLNFGDELISATGDGTYLYGETVKIDAELQEDYKWIQWLSADERLVANSTEMDFIFTMPNGEVVFTAVAEYVEYPYIAVKTLSLEREMTMVFYVDADALAGKENISLEVKKPVYADGNGEVIREEVDVVAEYTSANVLGKNMYRFVYGNLNAKEYGIEVTATLIADGRVKDVDTFSVREYAYGQLSKTTNAKFRTLLVDLLNYGAASQVYFN